VVSHLGERGMEEEREKKEKKKKKKKETRIFSGKLS
jgi:hypothetical protein